MNKRMIAHVIGALLLAEAVLLLLPAIVAVIYGESVPLHAFLISAVIVAAVGFALRQIKVTKRTIYSKEGLIAVALGWVVLSIGGALPFVISGEISSFVDALFETVSGFTTTGSSILTDVEALSKSMLFWRSFTHWVGGMGVLMFVLAALPLAGGGGNIHLMRAESPGPEVSKFVPSARGTALTLYGIYLAMTVLQIIIMLLCGNGWFESLTITFGTAGTGGFGTLNSSIASFNTATQIVVTVFMTAFGINFSFYYLLLIKRFKEAFKYEEVRAYLFILVAAIVIITVNTVHMYSSAAEALQHAAFQASSVMTTTGYSTVDFNQWPELSRMVMLVIMCIGACAGSTGGGFKVSRVVILAKEAKRQIKRAINPNKVEVVRFNGKPVSETMIRGLGTFLVLYVIIFVASVLLVSIEGKDTVSNISGVIATFNNIGPGLEIVGATGNFGSYTDFSKIVFIADMLLGRLEIIPMLALFSPRAWRK